MKLDTKHHISFSETKTVVLFVKKYERHKTDFAKNNISTLNPTKRNNQGSSL